MIHIFSPILSLGGSPGGPRGVEVTPGEFQCSHCFLGGIPVGNSCRKYLGDFPMHTPKKSSEVLQKVPKGLPKLLSLNVFPDKFPRLLSSEGFS